MAKRGRPLKLTTKQTKGLPSCARTSRSPWPSSCWLARQHSWAPARPPLALARTFRPAAKRWRTAPRNMHRDNEVPRIVSSRPWQPPSSRRRVTVEPLGCVSRTWRLSNWVAIAPNQTVADIAPILVFNWLAKTADMPASLTTSRTPFPAATPRFAFLTCSGKLDVCQSD